MKAVTILATFLFVFTNIKAQDCEPYFPIKEGTEFELTNYDAKGKVTGYSRYKILKKEGSGSKIMITATFESLDKKEESTYKTNYKIICEDGNFKMDMAHLISPDMTNSMGAMDVDIQADQLEIPSNPTPGQQLKDGTLTMKIGNGSMTMMNFKIDVTERKIEKKESITTPAGTFDCVMLSQKISTKMMVKIQGSSKEWYAKNVGTVRTESYNKKGKLMGYSVLTSFKD